MKAKRQEQRAYDFLFELISHCSCGHLFSMKCYTLRIYLNKNNSNENKLYYSLWCILYMPQIHTNDTFSFSIFFVIHILMASGLYVPSILSFGLALLLRPLLLLPSPTKKMFQNERIRIIAMKRRDHTQRVYVYVAR